MDTLTPSLDTPPVYWLTECPDCGTARTADRDDLFRFLRGPWPVCCGVAMTFHAMEGDPPLAEAAD
jgi:hypothetical protein